MQFFASVFAAVLLILVGGIGVGSFLAAVIAQLNGRDRLIRVRVRPTLISIQKGFEPTREKMDGEKKRDTKELAEYGTRTNSS